MIGFQIDHASKDLARAAGVPELSGLGVIHDAAIARIAALEASLRAMTVHATHGVGYLAPNHPDVVTARKLIKF